MKSVEMWSVENEQCGKCGVWKMWSVENAEDLTISTTKKALHFL